MHSLLTFVLSFHFRDTGCIPSERELLLPETHYGVLNKELLAIMEAFHPTLAQSPQRLSLPKATFWKFRQTTRIWNTTVLSQSYTAPGQVGTISYIVPLHNKQADALLYKSEYF